MSVAWGPVGQATALEGFQLSLEGFEGPLDLLLHLIDKQGLPITSVSVLAVTDQFLAYVRETPDRFADAASEFLLVGSQLTMLKSRALLPRPEPEPEEEEESFEDLAQRLRVYAAFKAVAEDFDARASADARLFIRVSPPAVPHEPPPAGVGDLHALIQAIEDMLAAQREASDVAIPQPTLRYRVDDKMAELESLLQAEGEVGFERVAATCRDRIELVVTFLAVLQLVSQRRILAEQKRPFGSMILRARTAHA